MPRKKSNSRRKKRQHVLDVKLASNQLRQRRVRIAISSVVTLLLVLAVVYGIWRGGYIAAQHFVYQNKNLSIEHFEVRTDGVIDPRHLIRWSGVRRGDNLFEVDLHEIKENLENHGMIRRVAIERSLPDTLRMQVHERTPLAMVRIGERDERRGIVYRKFALDLEGHLMNLDTNIVRTETALAWNKLPWLTTTNFNEVFTAPDLRNRQIKAALRFIAAFDAAAIREDLKIEKIDIDDPYVLRVMVSNGAVVDILGENFERQLARWKLIHVTLADQSESYSWMDLSVTNHVPVRRIPINPPINPPEGQRQF